MQEMHEVSIGFQIQALRVTAYSINEEKLVKGDDIGFGIQLEHSFSEDADQQVVKVALEVGHQPESPLVILHLECDYKLAGYRDWLNAQSKELRQPGNIPFGLATTLNSISISTARGVLFERLLGTALHGIVLPVINPSAFKLAK